MDCAAVVAIIAALTLPATGLLLGLMATRRPADRDQSGDATTEACQRAAAAMAAAAPKASAE